jgi:CDP-6-deoxy-D-xylo-4-hexulose-3-dehydrase
MTWKLMDDVIDDYQRQALSDFVKESDRFSQGSRVKQFEEEWSKWQGCKYSVFVNSGSSANFIATHAAMLKHGYHSTWVSQACTWATTVSPAMLSNNSIQLTDVTIPNLGVDLDSFSSILSEVRPKFLFLANLLGLPAVNDDLLEICDRNGVILLEDCCESHGATYKGEKVGNFGIMSTFSFYYGHHMTTIEGGMVCTDDEELYHNLLLLRSHGLLRELPEDARSGYDMVDPSFTFITPGFNVRSTEMNALLGSMQLKSLDDHNKTRSNNFERFVSGLDGNKYYNDFIVEGNSSFCFPIICKNGNRDELRKRLGDMGVETRPIIAGNLYEHPFMKSVNQYRYDDNAKIVHENGFYVGNNHTITSDQVNMLVEELNKA